MQDNNFFVLKKYHKFYINMLIKIINIIKIYKLLYFNNLNILLQNYSIIHTFLF